MAKTFVKKTFYLRVVGEGLNNKEATTIIKKALDNEADYFQIEE